MARGRMISGRDGLYSVRQSAVFRALRDSDYAEWCRTCCGPVDLCCCRPPNDARRTAAVIAMLGR